MAPLGGKLSGIDLPIRTSRLTLRLPRRTDAPRLTRLMNDPSVFNPVMSSHSKLTLSGERTWVRRSLQDARKGTKLPLIIEPGTGGPLIGGIGLEIQDTDNRRGWIGYWLAKPFWHQGFGTEAASAVCRVGIQKAGLHRIDAAVFAFNPRSMRLLKRLGFKAEGTRREVLYRGGRWHDEARFGLLAKEFRPRT